MVIVWLLQLGIIGQQNEALFRNAYLDTEWFYELFLPTSTYTSKPLSLQYYIQVYCLRFYLSVTFQK